MHLPSGREKLQDHRGNLDAGVSWGPQGQRDLQLWASQDCQALVGRLDSTVCHIHSLDNIPTHAHNSLFSSARCRQAHQQVPSRSGLCTRTLPCPDGMASPGLFQLHTQGLHFPNSMKLGVTHDEATITLMGTNPLKKTHSFNHSPFRAGKPGMYGPRGHAGAQGKMGKAGKTGARGRRGFPGKTGPEGGTGKHGVDGTAGARGPTGEQGPVGAVGKAGLPGVRGPAGLHGLPGPQGPIGTDGARGMRVCFPLHFAPRVTVSDVSMCLPPSLPPSPSLLYQHVSCPKSHWTQMKLPNRIGDQLPAPTSSELCAFITVTSQCFCGETDFMSCFYSTA